MRRLPEERFWERVDKDGPVPEHRPKLGRCWLWTGAPTARGGYGLIGAGGTRNQVRAHRFSYELLVGPIPAGLEIDHLCRVHLCVRPTHLEAVTHAENVRRGRMPDISRIRALSRTHCRHGHPFDEANTGRNKRDGSRYCRTCARIRVAARKARLRAEAAA